MDFRTKDGHAFPLTPTHPALSSRILNNKPESHESRKSRLNRLHDFAKKQKTDFIEKQKQRKDKQDNERVSKIKQMQQAYLLITESKQSDTRKLLLLNSLKQEYHKYLKLDKYLSSKIDKDIQKLTVKETPKDESDESNSQRGTTTNRSRHNVQVESTYDKFPTRSGELLDVGEKSPVTTRDILMLQSAGIVDPDIQIPEDDE